jgi:TctA family transporter
MAWQEAFFTGFASAWSAPHLAWCLFGAVAGALVGLLPGIGPLAAIALLLPVVPSLDATSAMILVAAVHYGAQVGGTTAASLASPAHGPSVAIPALASFVAGCGATIAIAAVLPAAAALGDTFGPAEAMAFMALALVGSVALASGSLSKAAGMILVGLLLGQLDHDLATGEVHLGVALPRASPGVTFIGLAIGIFAIGGVLVRLPGAGAGVAAPSSIDLPGAGLAAPPQAEASTAGGPAAAAAMDPAGMPESADERPASRLGRLALRTRSVVRASLRMTGPWPRSAELRRAAGPVLLGTLLGAVAGMLPGRSPRLAAIIAETAQRRVSKTHPAQAVDAVLAPESAHHAASQASLLPLLALGLPVNAVTAVMAGTLELERIAPGPPFALDAPVVPWAVVASMLVGNALLLVINLPLAAVWQRVRRVPGTVLFPLVVVAAGIGLWSMAGNPVDVYMGAFFGLVGALLFRLGCDPAPLLLAFVLGPAMENRLRQALAQTHGDWGLLATRPLAVFALFACVAIASLVWLPSVRERRNALFGDRG